MKKWMLLLLLGLGLTARADDNLEAMRHARSAGAPGLALHYLALAGLPSAEKEAQRIALLTDTGRHDEALAAAENYRGSAPDWAPRQAWLSGARSALALGENRRALNLLARLLWQSELAPDAYREARVLVIDAILGSGRGGDAYRAMLRYQQEFSPLPRSQVARFTEGLISAGMDAETVTWLADLDMDSPLRLLARLKAGLLTAQDAITEVRRILDPPPPPAPPKGKKSKTTTPLAAPAKPANELPYWAILMHAGLMAQDSQVAAEAMEKLMGARELPAGIWGVKPEVLWQAYGALARQEANQAQLLDGDDRAWLDLAISQASQKPLAARALFGHLAALARDAGVREAAQANWLQLMLVRRMERLAVRMLGAGKDEAGLVRVGEAVMKALPVDDIPRRREAWLVLGELAAARQLHAFAARTFLRAAEGDDALAQEARWKAAESLARAGLGQDAVALLKARKP